MGAGKTVTKLAAIGAAIAGAIFFWRKRQAHEQMPAATPPFPPAADRARDMP
ncbi:MAG TPA: DLW-39 family protein [Acidimicrobiia bacterium]|jgi:hypothetical protein